MNIAGTSIYDLKTLKVLNKYALCKRMPPWLKLSIYPMLATLLLAACLAKLLIVGELDKYVLFIIGLTYFFSAFMLYAYFFGPKNQLKGFAKKGGVISNNFLFDATGFAVGSENESGSIRSTARIEYSSLLGVVETKEYILFRNSNRTFYIVDKATLVGNDGEALQALLKSVFQKKYVTIKYV